MKVMHVLLVACLGFAAGGRADTANPVPAVMDTLASDSTKLFVRIERGVAPPMNVAETLNVTVATSGWPVAACAFKIGTDSRYIEIVSIEKGEIIDSCHWEYFRAVRIETENKVLYPKSLWSVVALAKFTADTVKPTCFGLKREATIMKLIVTSASNFPIKDSSAAIFFFWEDCRDNTLSDGSGETLLVSRQVVDYFDSSATMSAGILPTRLGTPEMCINPKRASRPQRKIEFHNGGLEFKVVLPKSATSIDSKKTD